MKTNLFHKACSHVKRLAIQPFYFSCLALLTLTPLSANYAQTLSIQFTDTVALNEAFPIRFTIENAEARTFEAPYIQNLEVVSGPNTSRNFSSINGQVKQSTNFTYWFRATKKGKIKVPKITITTDQGVLSCAETHIMVTENGPELKSQPQQPNMSNFGFDNDFLNQGFNGNMPDMNAFRMPNFSFQMPDINSMMPNMEHMLKQLEQMAPQLRMFEFSPSDPSNPYEMPNKKSSPKEEDNKPKIDPKTNQPIYKI